MTRNKNKSKRIETEKCIESTLKNIKKTMKLSRAIIEEDKKLLKKLKEY